MKKKVFCANEQVVVNHTFTIEGGEIIAHCDTCQRMVKFPGNVGKEELKDLIQAHYDANQGQIPAPTAESVAKELEKLEHLLAD